jgi:hypothetical protein
MGTLNGAPFPDNQLGAGGWPLRSSKVFPGEMTLCCPKCWSANVTQTVSPGGTGTGPGGRWRMGDPGSREMNKCEDCGFTHRYD